MIYTTGINDSWASLAFKFYQSSLKFRELKELNLHLPPQILNPFSLNLPVGTQVYVYDTSKIAITEDQASSEFGENLQQPFGAINSRGISGDASITPSESIFPWKNKSLYTKRKSSMPTS